ASRNALRSGRTGGPITASSSGAGTRIVSGSSTRGGRQRGDGRQLRLCGFLGSEGARRSRIGKQGYERELPDPRLDVVDSREPGPLERFDSASRIARTLHTDHGQADVGEAGVKSFEKERCRTGLSRRSANDHNAVRRRSRRARLLLDDRALQRSPKRRIGPRNELDSKIVT